MEIIIHSQSKFMDVQMEFNTIYPYLKVEFYRLTNSYERFNWRGEKVAGSESVNKYCQILKPYTVSMERTMKISEVEAHFQIAVGLRAEIFRKSGKQWIETSLTDEWTLEQQNMEGEHMSNY